MAVTIFATVDKEYLIMIISTAKIHPLPLAVAKFAWGKLCAIDRPRASRMARC
jgi:hypothetical protein